MILSFLVRLADDALIIGHRLSEWCGHGPILEQDIAMTNTALDHLGRARSLYQYAAQIFNELPIETRTRYFSSVSLQALIEQGNGIDEDNLAFLRDSWDFRNVLLVEQPNVDWAYTIARSFFFDCFNYLYYGQLQNSGDNTVAAIAEKALKEVSYHLKWSSEWVIRLGDGTEESNARMQDAVNNMWMYTGEFFAPADYETEMLQQKIGPDVTALHSSWTERVNNVFEEANIKTPENQWMQKGGKIGSHTEHLGYILSELQFMQRTYPSMQW